MNKRTKVKKKILENALSYDELINLSNEDCAKISRIYFNVLMVKGNLLEIKDERYWKIMKKYSEIEHMVEKIRKPHMYCPSHYLISIEEMKYLIEVSKEIPKVSNYLLKSDVKVEELNKRHEEIKKQFANRKTSKR